jgi:phosphatidylethanolamine-binding protein (PEBP) family uncharacterized protein
VVWNLDSSTSGLNAGEVPPAAHQGRNDFGNIGYDGPCPPPGHGVHHYHFPLYATATAISLPDGSTIADLLAALRPAFLAQAELVGTYVR